MLVTSSAGSHTYTVTAVSADGQSTIASLSYTVTAVPGSGPGTAPAPVQPASVSGAGGGFTFTLGVPGVCGAPAGSLAVTSASVGAGHGFRIVSYSFFIDKGLGRVRHVSSHGSRRTLTVYVANLVSTHAGRHELSLAGLRPGSHRVTLTILLRSSGKHRHTTKTIRLSTTFSVC